MTKLIYERKEFKCNCCGEIDTQFQLSCYAVENGWDTSFKMCTNCDEIDNFTEV